MEKLFCLEMDPCMCMRVKYLFPKLELRSNHPRNSHGVSLDCLIYCLRTEQKQNVQRKPHGVKALPTENRIQFSGQLQNKYTKPCGLPDFPK